MTGERREEALMLWCRKFREERLPKAHITDACDSISDEAGEQRDRGSRSEQREERPQKKERAETWTLAISRGGGERDGNGDSNPPGTEKRSGSRENWCKSDLKER